jgi:hypothetical protein
MRGYYGCDLHRKTPTVLPGFLNPFTGGDDGVWARAKATPQPERFLIKVLSFCGKSLALQFLRAE